MLRPPRGEGQMVGDKYEAPPMRNLFDSSTQNSQTPFTKGSFASLSEAADNYYLEREETRKFAARATALSQQTRKLIAQKTKLQFSLQQDLIAHGDADEHKRLGDLLLSNLSTAERRGGIVTLTNYYAEGEPRIELEVDEHSTLQEEAAQRFARYTKAKRAKREISKRLIALDAELATLRARENALKEIIAARDVEALDAFDGEKKRDERRSPHTPKRSESVVPGARRYRSTDGYEILVGRTARDNDHLTFRVARPHDLWLHAADYPGSHVVVRNPTRKEIPHRTIIEAAQLAANFSQARRDAKVDVHYTARKFLSKPKNSAPGLVRMSGFHSIAVEPRESLERI
jgi:predicted ribosome quality control (RQC) complex YloA/Tae2 family protein